MLQDLKYVLFWWLILFLVGSLSLPLILSVFKKFWDRGYIFSKTVSLIIVTYIVFVLGIFKFLSFTSSNIFLIIVLFLVADLAFLFQKQRRQSFFSEVKKHQKIILLEELIFLSVLIFWSYIRGFDPNINSLEKFMDWGFINSILRGTYIAPADMWYAGEPINYYYFGHLIFALLTKISGIHSAITYNLALATICALVFTGGFSLASNLVFLYHHFLNSDKKTSLPSKRNQIPKVKVASVDWKIFVLPGIFSAILLTFGGNLHLVYKLTQLNISQNNGQLVLTKDAFNKAVASYWYPDATRFIGFDPDTKDKTIHEFPLYSFIVADLHGHLNDIPVVIFFLAFLLAASLTNIKTFSPRLFIPSGLILSVAFMTNAWDFFVYGLVFAVVVFLVSWSKQGFFRSVNTVFVNGLSTIVFWYLFTLPFSLNFIPMAEGVRLVDSRTPFYQLFILYGGFWLICQPFALRFIRELFGKKTSDFSPSKVFAFSLILVATILIIIPELIYLKDIYIYEHRRANTMFKLVYQAFILYSLTAGFSVSYLSQSFKPAKLLLVYKFIVLLVFVSHLTYPFFAVRSAYGQLSEYQGLWGLAFLKRNFPDNYLAVDWINKNITGQPVMLEAAGDSYTLYNHISVSTGLPTVQGWLVHEWLWHGGAKDATGKYLNKTDCGDPCNIRNPDVQKIYESADLAETRRLLQKYSVDYVFIGELEVEKYQQLQTEKFEKLGQIVYESGKAKIYRLDK